jgi:Uma2 family endonuclease
VSVVCGRARFASDDPQALTNPVVIVEVLSPTTEQSDRGEKYIGSALARGPIVSLNRAASWTTSTSPRTIPLRYRHYRRLESLREYVLVAQDEPRIEVFRREGDVWTFREHGPGERVMLASIEAVLDVDAIYADPAG